MRPQDEPVELDYVLKEFRGRLADHRRLARCQVQRAGETARGVRRGAARRWPARPRGDPRAQDRRARRRRLSRGARKPELHRGFSIVRDRGVPASARLVYRRALQTSCRSHASAVSRSPSLLFYLSRPRPAGRRGPETRRAFARLGPIVLHGNEADNLMLGQACSISRQPTSPAGTLEYRFGRKVFVVGPRSAAWPIPRAGSSATSVSTWISRYRSTSPPSWRWGPTTRATARDLGGNFQFRESLDLTYRFVNGHRLGVRGAHLQRRPPRGESGRGGSSI